MSTPDQQAIAARAAAMGTLRVELERLQATSDELVLEIDQLHHAAERLRGNPNFGDSRVRGAAAIGVHHQEAILLDMQRLIRDINGGLRAGEAVLRQIARRYEEANHKNKKAMEKLEEELEALLERKLGAEDSTATPPFFAADAPGDAGTTGGAGGAERQGRTV